MHVWQALVSASLVVFTKTFVGFGCVSLLIELHSSTLHLRVLLKLYTRTQATYTYQILKLINMATFFVFRFGSLFFLVYALVRDRFEAHAHGLLGIYIFMCFALTVILLLSVQLFFKVIKADFKAKKAEPIKAKPTKEELLGIPPPHVDILNGNGCTEKIMPH